MFSITNNIFTDIYRGVSETVLRDGKNKSNASTTPPSENSSPNNAKPTSPLTSKLNDLIAKNGLKKTQLISTPASAPQDSDDYPNLTDKDKEMIRKAIQDDIKGGMKFPSWRGFKTEAEYEQTLDKILDTAKGQAAALLGKKATDLSLNDWTILSVRSSLCLINDKAFEDVCRPANLLADIISYNFPASLPTPEEKNYIYGGPLIPGEGSGMAFEQVAILIQIIDTKNGGHMSGADIQRLWGKFKNYVKDHPNVLQGDGINLSTQDYKNILNQCSLSDAEDASVAKYSKEYNVDANTLGALVAEIDKNTGKHMSDEDIKKLAESLKQDQDEGKDIGTSDKLGAESLQLIEKFSAPPPTDSSKSGSSDDPTGDISPEEQAAINKCVQDFGISEKILRTMVSIIDKQTGKHMSDQAIQQLAEGMPS